MTEFKDFCSMSYKTLKRPQTVICLPKSHPSSCQKASCSQSPLQMAELLGVSDKQSILAQSRPCVCDGTYGHAGHPLAQTTDVT